MTMKNKEGVVSSREVPKEDSLQLTHKHLEESVYIYANAGNERKKGGQTGFSITVICIALKSTGKLISGKGTNSLL